MYKLEQYYNQDTNRYQWAALHVATGTWYFAKRYGKHEANSLVRRLNQKAN